MPKPEIQPLFPRLFPRPPGSAPAVVAMIHLPPLPGTPRAESSPRQVADEAARQAALYLEEGADALLIENMGDRPYLRAAVGPEITACMTAAALAVREAAGSLPIGVQVLAGANREALAVALAAGLQFIRAESFVFGHLADEGWMQAQAGDLLRYRRAIGAEHVAVWADIRKKHAAHAASADLSLADWAREAEFAGADALVLTGASTGLPADPEALSALEGRTALPLVIGSGIAPHNAAAYRQAQAWIVGSSLKAGGHWQGAPERERVRSLLRAARGG